jgi:CxxC motif-containing protein (DUF1111 family)
LEQRWGAVLAGGVGVIGRSGRRWRSAGVGLALLLIPSGIGKLAFAGGPPGKSAAAVRLGEELFNREWKPNDPRCHGGDGLGPVYNETSCVACHGLGGPGGAGPSGMNVQIISAIGTEIGNFSSRRGSIEQTTALARAMSAAEFVATNMSVIEANAGDGVVCFHFSSGANSGRFRNGFVFSGGGKTLTAREFDLRLSEAGGDSVLSCAAGSITAKSIIVKPDEDALREIHPALVVAPSAAIHHYGVEPGYEAWRSRLMGRIPPPSARSDLALRIVGGKILATQRNSPPLFGLGLIDAIPDDVLVATAEREPPRVRGRVSRMTSGRIGRFGWKAQTADLQEFVLGACASELGLEVPGHAQAISPLAPDNTAKALDLTLEECDALVAYVKALPAPIQLDDPDPRAIEAGRLAFEEVGCADCHRSSLGNINGIYSDLLLHDMGQDLFSVTFSAYYGPTVKMDIPSASSMADGSDWRTPPLWGYRDSAPYLHDGRASDLHEVVKAHKGQASDSAARFFHLPVTRRSQVEHFLKSLAAPPADLADLASGSATRHSTLGRTGSPPRASRRVPSNRAEATARAEQDRRADSRLKMARALEKMGKPEGALVFYREILAGEPDTAAARTAAARIKALRDKDGAGKGP